VAVPSGPSLRLEPGGPAFLFTHLVVRRTRSALRLPDRSTRTFEALRAPPGSGEAGLAILSAHSPSALRRAVLEATSSPHPRAGVGKRTAQRLHDRMAAKLGTDTPTAASTRPTPGRVRRLEGLG